MKVLIVAKTRRGMGACVGGIDETGRSVRVIADDTAHNERAGLEYEVGEVWEVESAPDPDLIPPHVENIIVHRAERLRLSDKISETIARFMPPLTGGPEKLFDGCTRATASGGLYICKAGGLPARSTMFWIADQPLRLDCEGKRIRYRYPTPDGGRTLTFVGFQEPVPEIPAGTLLRVSLAHWWHPRDNPGEELRCFVQLSGWFAPRGLNLTKPKPATSQAAPTGSLARATASGTDLRYRALEVLKHTFGFSEFLPLQWEVIERLLRQKDTLVVMPTGAGKSLCYQLPALLLEGLTVVVSPLVALMRDQVTQLEQSGVPAACLNHLVPLRDYQSIMSQVRGGRIRLLYLAPETLLRPEILLLLEQSRLACVAIDEAHCISEWGHDFRPEYRELAALRARFPGAVWAALTATATSRVRDDIRRQLAIPPEGEFVATFNRRNLFLAAELRRDCLRQVLAFLQSRRGHSGIIYCGKRKQADDLCAALNANGWPALTYHAGMDGGERHKSQSRFSHDEVPLIVATVAFGMGINKSNVRFIIHAHLPKDLESYYQEIGRAGRDGLPADCLLLYTRGDAVLHRRFIEQGAASQRIGRETRLTAMLQFAQAHGCRRKPLLAYFGESLATECGACDNCVRVTPQTGRADFTSQAVRLLACARSTEQIFGQEHLVQVLRGSRAEKIRRRGHDKLSVFGAGRDHSAREWHAVAENLVRQELLDRDPEFGSLRLTPKGWSVLNGKEKFFMPAPLLPFPATPEPSVPADSELLQKLKALRRQLADEAGLPAYIIFSDRSLVEMATRSPHDEHQFLSINGVGELKLAKYGPRFLGLIRQHHPPSALVTDPAAAPGIVPIERVSAGRRAEQIGEQFLGGQTLAQLAAFHQIQTATVIQHLYCYHKAGGKIEPARLLAASNLSASEQTQVFDVFARLGTKRLAPVYLALNGSVPYQELHLLRLWFFSEEAE